MDIQVGVEYQFEIILLDMEYHQGLVYILSNVDNLRLVEILLQWLSMPKDDCDDYCRVEVLKLLFNTHVVLHFDLNIFFKIMIIHL